MQKNKGIIRYTKINKDGPVKLGKLALEQGKNRKYNTHSAQEQVDEELKNYPNQVMECVENGKKHFNSDFYVQVLFCLDRIIPDYRKNIFAAQRSCPTPFYDQVVYKYHKNGDRLEFLWNVPDIDLCKFYRDNFSLVPDDEKWLYKNIMDFYSGKLAVREHLENTTKTRS
jgi:hypothetical protein